MAAIASEFIKVVDNSLDYVYGHVKGYISVTTGLTKSQIEVMERVALSVSTTFAITSMALSSPLLFPFTVMIGVGLSSRSIRNAVKAIIPGAKNIKSLNEENEILKNLKKPSLKKLDFSIFNKQIPNSVKKIIAIANIAFFLIGGQIVTTALFIISALVIGNTIYHKCFAKSENEIEANVNTNTKSITEFFQKHMNHVMKNLYFMFQ